MGQQTNDVLGKTMSVLPLPLWKDSLVCCEEDCSEVCEPLQGGE